MQKRRDILSLPRIITIGSIVVFTIIAGRAFLKRNKHAADEYTCIAKSQVVQEISLEPMTQEKPLIKENITD